MQRQPIQQGTINRLTALWALSESGLGGIMHALKIPFTGFFLGGFAVIMIGLIAHYSHSNLRQMLQATLLVVLVKAAVSPHSPFPAYIAVGFQGLCGALLFGAFAHIPKGFNIAAILFGLLALLESAVQKFLMTTLLFGKSVWEALDAFFLGIVKDLHLPADFSFSYWLILTYTAGYAVWGIVLGFWITRLPAQVEARAEQIGKQLHEVTPVAELSPQGTEKKKRKKWWGVLFVLLFIGGVFITGGAAEGSAKALYVIIRTVAVLLLFFYVVNPLLRWTLAKWSGRNKTAVQELVDQLPELRGLVRPAYRLAAAEHKGIRKYQSFVLTLIVLSLKDTQQKYRE